MRIPAATARAPTKRPKTSPLVAILLAPELELVLTEALALSVEPGREAVPEAEPWVAPVVVDVPEVVEDEEVSLDLLKVRE